MEAKIEQKKTKLLEEGLQFFESIKSAEICAIQAGKREDREAEIYNKEIAAIQEKRLGYLQLSVF
jgi:hypothetical protein